MDRGNGQKGGAGNKVRSGDSTMAKGGRGRGEKRGGGEGDWRVAFWNVAGLRNKDKEFWEGVREWNVMVFSETWVEEKDWGRVKGKLPKGYVWRVQGVRKKNKKGRAIGGMVMGIRKGMWEKEEVQEVEGVIVGG